MEIEEDTIIAIGFVVGAVLLVVIILIWVIIYCLCCRKRDETQTETPEKRTKQADGRFRYLSTESNRTTNHADSSISASSIQSGRSYQRQLPELPNEGSSNSGRPTVLTPECNLEAEPKGVVNQGFITNMDSMYAYCDDMPRYRAPDAPHGCNEPNHSLQPSNELRFLERKYNIKADDTDNVHNSRPLTCCSNTSSAYLPIAGDGENAESYADVNNLLRSFSILSPEEDEMLHKKKSYHNNASGDRELNQNHNANLPDSDSKNSTQSTGHDALPLEIIKDTDKHIEIDSSSTTIDQRSQLKEIEEISFDAQNISPESDVVMSPTPIEVIDNMTYFSTLELTEGQVQRSGTPDSDYEPAKELASDCSTRSTAEAEVPESSRSGRPIPRPRHSRSASVDSLASPCDTDVCNDYTNIPPLPMPRSLQPATLGLQYPQPEL